MTATTRTGQAPAVETDLTRVYDLPPRPPDDVAALREQRHPHQVWERSRIDPTKWFNSATGTMLSYRELVAKHAPLREHHLDLQVWVVRADAQIPPRLHGIYSNEPAAVAVAGGSGDRRVHPWTVLHTPEPDPGLPDE